MCLNERHTATAYSFTSKVTACDMALYFSAVFHPEYFKNIFIDCVLEDHCLSLVYSVLLHTYMCIYIYIVSLVYREEGATIHQMQ